MQGDWAAMGAYADYLEENDQEKELVVGLRFCVRYKKFPRVYLHRPCFWWNCSKINKITKNTHSLPLFLEQMSFFDYASARSAITAVGRTIIQINKTFKEIV